MQLLSLTLKGYKRFEEETLVNLSGSPIALIGPNEAGKSTILDALKEVTSDEPLDASKRSRGYTGDMYVRAKYSLDDDDRRALAISPAATKSDCGLSRNGKVGMSLI